MKDYAEEFAEAARVVAAYALDRGAAHDLVPDADDASRAVVRLKWARQGQTYRAGFVLQLEPGWRDRIERLLDVACADYVRAVAAEQRAGTEKAP